MDKDSFLTLYKALVRSHLDYGNLIYFPITKKNKQLVENAQRRAARLLHELQGLSYEQRLARLDLPSLEYRRQRFDLIQVFKIINNIDDIDASVFFSYSGNQLRGHSRKLNKPRARKAIRLNSFSHRTITA